MIEKETKDRLIPKVILGTRKDQQSLGRYVNYEDAKNFCKSKDINFYEITSHESDELIKIIQNLLKIQKIYIKYNNFIYQNKINEKQ